MTLITLYYYYVSSKYSMIYQTMTFLIGFSVFSTIPYLFIAYRRNFSDYCKISLWGILAYTLVNFTIFLISGFFGGSYGMLSKILVTLVLTMSSSVTTYYFIKSRINK